MYVALIFLFHLQANFVVFLIECLLHYGVLPAQIGQ